MICFLKRTIAVLLTVLILLSALGTLTLAEEDDKWLFIDGENITRSVNTAIIYSNIPSTGQNSRGYNVVVDSNGTVTKLIETGLLEGENLAVPESGMVISASGTKIQWLKTNLKVGSRVYYDAYTKRLFVLDEKGGYNPYFTKQFNVSGEGNYIISNIEADENPIYTYSVAVDTNGKIVARGGNVTAPEGGYLLSAAVASDMQKLIMYAPVGGKCVISEGVATLSYDSTMLNSTLSILLTDAKTKVERAKAEFVYTDYAVIDAIIAKYEIESTLNYKTVCEGAFELTVGIDSLCFDNKSGELRAAFYAPVETDINQVRSIVKKVKELGLNTLFLKVTNGYGTFIPLPNDDMFTQDASFKGFDLLKAYISVCEEENIELGLSVDVYYNQYASIAKPEWLSEPNKTEIGLSQSFYSPENEEFKEYFLGYLKYIVKNYEIKNVILDSLRYPRFSEDCDIGYDYETLQRFSEKYKININEANAIKTELFNSPHWTKWVEFRTELVSDMARQASAVIKSESSDTKVFAIAARDSVDHFYMQDATGWMEEGIFDGLCLALYDGDANENDKIDDLAYYGNLVSDKGEIISAYTGKTAYFFTALDSSGKLPNELLMNAISDTRSIGSDGFIFSDLSGFVDANYGSSLKNSALKGDSASPLGETKEFIKSVLEASKIKISDFILPQGGCDSATAESALSRINEAIALLNNDGLTYDEAQSLENDISMLFSSSNAKKTVVSDFAIVTKSALLYKEYIEPIIPDESNDNSSEESKTEDSEAVEEESIPENENNQNVIVEKDKGIGFGVILMYIFVAFSLITAVIALVVGLKRRKTRPKRAFMPKAGLDQSKDKEE